MKELEVGDKVLIKSKYDPGCNDESYNACFTDYMLEQFGGKIAIITNKRFAEYSSENKNRIPDDDFTYELDIDNGDCIWRSSMFDFGLYARIFYQ